MTKLLALITGNPIILVWLLAGSFALGAASGGGLAWTVQGWRLGAEIKSLEAQHAQAVADANKLALTASENYRREEHRLSKKVKGAENVLKTETVKNAAVAAGLRAERDGLRNEIAAFAAGASGATDDTAAAASDRAQRLGALLADTLQREEDFAGAAEDNAASVRALLTAWPK